MSQQRAFSGSRFGRASLVGMGLVAILLAGGCTSIKDHRGYIADPGLLDSVLPGVDNKVSVEASLGRPTFVSSFGEPAWYYVGINTAQGPLGRPETETQLVTRVTFDPAGNVATVEKRDASRVARIDPAGGKTPTLGSDRSFLEDLFGNIGAVGAGGGPGAAGGSGGPGPNGS